MRVEIISTGDELLSGAVVDTNSAFIGSSLAKIGLRAERLTVAGDSLEDLVDLFQTVSKRADIVIVTGGLGPTSDDLTVEAVSKAAGVKTELNEQAMDGLSNYFNKKGKTVTSGNKKQVMLPEGSICIDNHHGTAPGFMLKFGNCRFFFMPGVPREMTRMVRDSVLPLIRSGSETYGFFLEKKISLFGLPESEAGQLLAGFESVFPTLKLGFRAVFPIIEVKITIEEANQNIAEQLLISPMAWVMSKVGKWVFSTDDESMAAVVGACLLKDEATLAVAESCTGGLIGSMITDMAGSSDYFLFSGVTYSNEAKMSVLGVAGEIIEKYGAVHERTAAQMAKGAREISGADYAIATSGIAGPGGGSAEKPVGTLCIGFANRYESEGIRVHFSFDDRRMNKKIFAIAALDFLRRKLQQGGLGNF